MLHPPTMAPWMLPPCRLERAECVATREEEQAVCSRAEGTCSGCESDWAMAVSLPQKTYFPTVYLPCPSPSPTQESAPFPIPRPAHRPPTRIHYSYSAGNDLPVSIDSAGPLSPKVNASRPAATEREAPVEENAVMVRAWARHSCRQHMSSWAEHS